MKIWIGIGGDTNLFRRDTRDEEGSHLYPDTVDTYVISKKFGFIKRLVESDKIDRDKVLISFSMSESDGLGNYYGHGVENYQRMLMLLSISGTPIDDLISYLK